MDKDNKTAIYSPYVQQSRGRSEHVKERKERYIKKTKVELLKMKTTIFEMKTQNCYGN